MYLSWLTWSYHQIWESLLQSDHGCQRSGNCSSMFFTSSPSQIWDCTMELLRIYTMGRGLCRTCSVDGQPEGWIFNVWQKNNPKSTDQTLDLTNSECTVVGRLIVSCQLDWGVVKHSPNVTIRCNGVRRRPTGDDCGNSELHFDYLSYLAEGHGRLYRHDHQHELDRGLSGFWEHVVELFFYYYVESIDNFFSPPMVYYFELSILVRPFMWSFDFKVICI